MGLSNRDGIKRTRTRDTSSTEVDGRYVPLLPLGPVPGAQYAARSVAACSGEGAPPRLVPCDTTGLRQHPLEMAGESRHATVRGSTFEPKHGRPVASPHSQQVISEKSSQSQPLPPPLRGRKHPPRRRRRNSNQLRPCLNGHRCGRLWACVVPLSTMQHTGVLLGRDCWMKVSGRLYRSLPPRAFDHRTPVFVPSVLASDGGFHFRYDGAVGIILSSEPQLLFIHLVLTRQYIVDKMPQPVVISAD